MIKPLRCAIKAILYPIKYQDSSLKLGAAVALVLAVAYTYSSLTHSKTSLGLQLIVNVMLAFSWHRIVLLKGVKLNWYGAEEGRSKSDRMMIGKRLRKFALMSLALGLTAAFIGFVVIYGSLLPKGGSPTLRLFIWIIVFAFIAPVFFRIALIFPAIAVGHIRDDFVDAWEQSDGKTYRIFMSYFFVGIVWFGFYTMAMIFTGLVLSISKNLVTVMFTSSLLAIANVYFIMVWAGLNSTIFRALYGYDKDSDNLVGADAVSPTDSQ